MEVTHCYIHQDSCGVLDKKHLFNYDEALKFVEQFQWDNTDELDPKNVVFSTDRKEEILLTKNNDDNNYWIEISLPNYDRKKILGFISVGPATYYNEFENISEDEMKAMLKSFFYDEKTTLISNYF